MIERLSKTKRNIALAVIASLVIWFSWTVRSVLNPLLLGYILATMLHPMVGTLEARGWSRRASVNLIFASFSVLLAGVGVGVYVQGRALTQDVFDSDVDLLGRVEDAFNTFIEEHPTLFAPFLEDGFPQRGADPTDGGGEAQEAGGMEEAEPAQTEPQETEPQETGPQEIGAAAPDQAEPGPVVGEDAARDAAGAGGAAAQDEDHEYLSEFLRSGWEALSSEQMGAGEIALRGAGSAWSVLQVWFGSLLGFFSLLLLLPIYTYFLLFQLERINGFVRRYLPVRERERLSGVASQIGEVLANFFRGRLLICFLKGSLLTIGLGLVGTPFYLLLGMGSGFLALVPFVGPLLGFVVAFVIGFVPADAGFAQTLLETAVVFLVAEFVEGYVMIPKILGDSLGLHPVVVLASVFVGGAALGMFGFLIAIPLTASLVIVGRELVLPAMAAFADELHDGEDKSGRRKRKKAGASGGNGSGEEQ